MLLASRTGRWPGCGGSGRRVTQGVRCVHLAVLYLLVAGTGRRQGGHVHVDGEVQHPRHQRFSHAGQDGSRRSCPWGRCQRRRARPQGQVAGLNINLLFLPG